MLLLLIAAALPFLFPTLLRSLLRTVGQHLLSQSQSRRNAIIALARKDLASQSPSQPSPEDSDWEHVSTSTEQISRSASAVLPKAQVIGFFHPFSNAGGGGERVLWAAIRATQKAHPDAICVVYTGDHDVDRDIMVESVRHKFGLTIQRATLHFVYLTKRNWVLASSWPHFTLLGQSLGSIGLAYDALSMLVPDIFIDTMGYAFADAFCKFLFPSMPVGAYVHYPTISTDMLSSLDDTTSERGLNAGAGTGLKGTLKKHYWHLFARLYGWTGRHIDVVTCNSSWTASHIRSLWTLLPPDPTIIYPPCPVEELSSFIPIDTSSESTRTPTILYIAQFRPEKNHALILRSFAKYLHSLPSTHPSATTPRLTLLGSVRPGTPDEKNVYALRLLSRELKVAHATTFLTDASFPQVRSELASATVGTNGMWNEHFGIGVVEYLAAGLIPVVHDSGGPKMDIVGPPLILPPGRDGVEGGGGGAVGFLAATEDEFAAAFARVLDMGVEEKVGMRRRARERARTFSEENFEKGWNVALERLLDLLGKGARKRDGLLKSEKVQ